MITTDIKVDEPNRKTYCCHCKYYEEIGNSRECMLDGTPVQHWHTESCTAYTPTNRQWKIETSEPLDLSYEGD